MAAKPKRCIDECPSQQDDDEAESRVVVATERLGTLELANGRVEFIRVIRQGAALDWPQASGIDGMKQEPAGCSYAFHRVAGPWSPGRGSDCQPPPKDHHGGRYRPKADQNQQNSLMEGETHRPPR
jgi:hypothetical protein